MAFGGGASDEGGTRDRVIAEMNAICAAPEFERAPVMRRLLTFLVETTLEGKGSELKAYSVAVDGLGRDADFDSQSDSYPRVQVGRLRKMLDAYYVQHGSDEGIRLLIPTGGYRVHFADPGTPADAAEPILAETSLPDQPIGLRGLPAGATEVPAWLAALTPAKVAFTSIAVVILLGALVLALSPSYRQAFIADPAATVERAPVLELGAIDIAPDPSMAADAMRIRALLADALHRSWIVRIREAADTRDGSSAGQSADPPDYRLAGQIVPARDLGDHRLYLWLWDARSGNQIWSNQMVLPKAKQGFSESLTPIISTLIRPFGVIATQERARIRRADALGYGCLLLYESYFRDRAPELRDRVNTCIAETVRRDGTNAPALAAASFLAFDPKSGGGTAKGNAAAAEFVRRSVAADPYSAEAHVADARVAFVAGQCRRGVESADRAMALNPYTPELMGLMGFLLYQCDDPRAVNMLRTAQALDPEMPAFYRVTLVLALIEGGEIDEALRMADGLRPPGAGMAGPYALTQSIASAARGDIPGARAQWQRAVNASGVTSGRADAVIGRFLYSPHLRAKLIRYLVRMGVIPPQPP